jgi:hypothetical protein
LGGYENQNNEHCGNGTGDNNSTSNNQGNTQITTIWETINPLGLIRTDGNSSSYAGQSARYETLVITQNGTSISGTWNEMDTLGASTSFDIAGSINGNTITFQMTDLCNRTVTGTGTMGTSSMSLLMSGPATGGSGCGAFSATIP